MYKYKEAKKYSLRTCVGLEGGTMADDILIQTNEMSEVTVASSSKCQLDQLFGPLSFQSDYICCSGVFS